MFFGFFYKIKKMKNKLALILVLSLLASGCVNKKIEVLERNFNSLQEQVYELKNKTEDQEKKIVALQKDSEALKQQIDKLKEDNKLKEENDPYSLYSKGLNLYNQKKYSQAIETFLLFLQKFPDNSLSDNSLYWIGESYLKQNNTQLARQYFRKVYKEYPTSNKVPDAYFKIGLIYFNRKKYKTAKIYFNKVIKDYPFTEAAKLSENYLKKIKRRK